MMRTVILLAVALGGVACEKKPKDAPATASPTPGSAKDTGSGSAAVAPTPPEPTIELLPAKLDAKTGIVVADKRGGKVEGIPDGTRVKIIEVKDISAGDMADGAVTVEHAGKQVVLKADRVLRDGEDLHRSPDGKHAVFAPFTACGDFCHRTMWLISADGRRTKLGEAGPDIHIAWHPKTSHVAAGTSGSIHIVALADHKATQLEDFVSPAYAPDGTLYVRDLEGSAFTAGAGKPALVWKSKDAPDTEDEAGPSLPEPVTFVDGKPKLDAPWADFDYMNQ